MIRRERSPLLLFVVLLGVGLLAAAYAIWSLEAQVRANQTLIRQQQQTVSALLAQSADDRQALSEQQRLTRALQEQVRQLGGSPLLTPPSPAATSTASPSTSVAPSTTPPPAAASPRPTRSPTPRPTSPQSPTPTPSPTSTCAVKVGPICL